MFVENEICMYTTLCAVCLYVPRILFTRSPNVFILAYTKIATLLLAAKLKVRFNSLLILP